MVSRTAQKNGAGPLSGAQLSGVVQNSKGLRRVGRLLKENPEVEFMYLRENEIRKFEPAEKMEKLRVLDLSMNQIGPKVDFLSLLPRLHHLYLSVNEIETLEGFSGLVGLETLCISDNAITSFHGLSNLPNLRVLSLNFNAIRTFDQYPSLPNLHTLNLVGNPITEAASYRSMAIAVNNNNLVSIDGKPVKEEERAAVDHYHGKVVYCIRSGYVIENESNADEAADSYMKKHHRAHGVDDNGIVRLSSIRINAADGSRSGLMEGNPVQLSVALQDVRPLEESKDNLFSSPQLVPTVFTVRTHATEVILEGSFTNWVEPLVLQRVPEPAEEQPAEEQPAEGEEAAEKTPTYETTLYLPPGEYEYRFLLDGEEHLDESGEHANHEGTRCNKREVKEPEPLVEEKSTIFHIRWMRQASSGAFELVEREHNLVYVPIKADIGCCLRAEVLAYVNGQFSFLFFDISSPIIPAPPQCTRLEIKGEAKENQLLLVEADYFGGEEGSSSLTWTRVTPAGEEFPIHLQNPFGGFKVTKDCIGCTIKVTFTPVRNDWVPGEPKTAVTDVIEEGNPECESIKIIGNLIENSQLEVEVVYTGGVEGVSQYQWLRKGPSFQYMAIEGETGTTYHTTAEDVGKSLAVEYTPVNDKGKEGEACRCVLDNLIAPASPEVHNISIYGELKENEVLALQYDYIGGQAGHHIINWYRRHPGAKKPTKIGTPNSHNLTLTTKDIGAVIEVTMTPVRSDKVRGATVLAKTASCVVPCEPAVKYLSIVGTPAVHQTLEVEVEYVGGMEGNSRIQWETESLRTGEVSLVSRNERRYTVQPADSGKLLRVVYIPVRSDGMEGEAIANVVEIETYVPPPPPKLPTPKPVTPKEPTPKEPTPKAVTPKEPTPKAETPKEPTPVAAATYQDMAIESDKDEVKAEEPQQTEGEAHQEEAAPAEAVASQGEAPAEVQVQQEAAPAEAVASQGEAPAEVEVQQEAAPAEAVASQGEAPAEVQVQQEAAPAEVEAEKKEVTE